MADDPTTGPTDRHAADRDRRRRPRMRVSGRSLQHVVNAIAKRGADAKDARAAAASPPDTRETGDTPADLPRPLHPAPSAMRGRRKKRDATNPAP